jgi:dCMP deaminase
MKKKDQIELKEIMLNAALRMTTMDPSISMEDAKARIQDKTGFPAIEENRNKEYERLSWDSYFMSLAFLVAMRSPDSQTQHGCVIVDQNNSVVSTGYNGWLQGAVDESMPNTRPYKCQHIVHSEANAILAAEYRSLQGCKAYVTGLPCNECLKLLARKGIKEIVIGDRPHVFADGYLELHCLICAMHQISITKFTGKIAHLDGREIRKEDHAHPS